MSLHDLRACLIPDQKYKSAPLIMHEKQLLKVFKSLEFRLVHDSIADTLIKAKQSIKWRYGFNVS